MLPNFALGRELQRVVGVVSAGGVGMRAAENDTPSNLARVERRSRGLRLSRVRPLRSRQP
jgi:hypothetical protein